MGYKWELSFLGFPKKIKVPCQGLNGQVLCQVCLQVMGIKMLEPKAELPTSARPSPKGDEQGLGDHLSATLSQSSHLGVWGPVFWFPFHLSYSDSNRALV